MQTCYPLAVGEADHKRLALLNQIYNPQTKAFISAAGLSGNLSILEIGCGTGEMAIWLAQHFPDAKVLATDINTEQLAIARETAQKNNISNIEFRLCNVVDLPVLQQSFDLIYGRWVLEYIENPQAIIQTIFNLLNPNGVMIYAAISFLNPGFFCNPHSDIIMQWMNFLRPQVLPTKLDRDLSTHIYHMFKNIGYQDIQMMIDQPLLVTSEERSLLRLGFTSMRTQLLNRQVMTAKEHENMTAEFLKLEQEDMIFANHRNLLIRGTKK